MNKKRKQIRNQFLTNVSNIPVCVFIELSTVLICKSNGKYLSFFGKVGESEPMNSKLHFCIS